MTFANLHVLWFLAVIIPGLLVFFWWSWRIRRKLLTQFIQARLLPALTVGISDRRQKIRLAALASRRSDVTELRTRMVTA